MFIEIIDFRAIEFLYDKSYSLSVILIAVNHSSTLSCLKQASEMSNFCLKQAQGLKASAASPNSTCLNCHFTGGVLSELCLIFSQFSHSPSGLTSSSSHPRAKHVLIHRLLHFVVHWPRSRKFLQGSSHLIPTK